MNVRNSYLTSHALWNYLWASLLSSAAMQLTVTVDAIILGRFVGSDALSAITASVPLQLLARSIAVMRDCDVDQPRNLAKSVTVE